ncbi:GNAT family N-acetyltransferase [Streptomyces xantholiticus]|uniref:GNAT family N-acetyltransferase n=1 Tax=Streptomyces xantholiticus TaxID=68285 RepID=UPI0016759E56|nr:GNAT family N-acetyltransferase [Streptomyces xantholiticus]GGW67308.1 N-acetyltransferase [Streptomyces xantholiticus]
MTSWTIAPEPFDSKAARALWRAYYTEISDRWYQREFGLLKDYSDELEQEIVAATGAEFGPPSGTLLVARYGGEAVGCAGVHLLEPGTAEVKRVFLTKEVRGKGGADLLLEAVEKAALDLGARRLVLDTRIDLVEARALYARHGYVEIPAHNDCTFSDLWFEKRLAPA